MMNYLIVPEVVYMLLLLCSWITAMFSGIAFVYGIFMKKTKKCAKKDFHFSLICAIIDLQSNKRGEKLCPEPAIKLRRSWSL